MGDTGQHSAPAANGMNPQGPPGPPFKVYVAGVPKNFAADDLQPYFDRVSSYVSHIAWSGGAHVHVSRMVAKCQYRHNCRPIC